MTYSPYCFQNGLYQSLTFFVTFDLFVTNYWWMLVLKIILQVTSLMLCYRIQDPISPSHTSKNVNRIFDNNSSWLTHLKPFDYRQNNPKHIYWVYRMLWKVSGCNKLIGFEIILIRNSLLETQLIFSNLEHKLYDRTYSSSCLQFFSENAL